MTMSVTTIKQINENYEADSHGPTITSMFALTFTGTFSTVYLYQNANAIGLPDLGDYVTGTSSDLWCSHTNAAIAPGSPLTSSTTGAMNPSVCHYTAKFSTLTAERLDLSPLSRPMVITGGGIDLTEVRQIDIQGNAITNSAGDMFTNLPDFYVPGSEISLSYNVSGNPLSAAASCSFTTNSSAIWGQAAYSGMVGKVSYERLYETYAGVLIEYWRMTVPIRFRNDGNPWGYFQPYDAGYRYLKSGVPTNWIDPTTGVFAEIFLNGSGGLLGSAGTGTPVLYPAASGSTPAGFQTMQGSTWSALSIPANPFVA